MYCEYCITCSVSLSERINIRVIDPFTIKPLDSKTIIEHAKATRGRIVTVEDHYYEGGYSAHTGCFLDSGYLIPVEYNI